MIEDDDAVVRATRIYRGFLDSPRAHANEIVRRLTNAGAIVHVHGEDVHVTQYAYASGIDTDRIVGRYCRGAQAIAIETDVVAAMADRMSALGMYTD